MVDPCVLITALVAVKVTVGLPGTIGGRLLLVLFRPKALETGPGFDQSAIDREVFVAGQALPTGLTKYLPEKLPRHTAFQQTVAVLGEDRCVPTPVRPGSCRQTSETAGCSRSIPLIAVRCGSSTAAEIS